MNCTKNGYPCAYTKKTHIILAWLVGAQCDLSGNYSEGFNAFGEYRNDLKNDKGEYDLEEIQKCVDFLIQEYGKEAEYRYYDVMYFFKDIPTKTINRLAVSIKKIMETRFEE